MSRRTWLIPSAVALAALMAAGGVAFASGSSSSPTVGSWGQGLISLHGPIPAAPQGAEVITVIAHTAHTKFVDADDSGTPSVGDYFVFTDNVFDPQTHVQVGVDHAKCTIDFDAIVCEGTFTLFDRGDIAIETSLTETANLLAITGGTGEFLDNSGEAILQDLGDDNTMFTFFLT